jgi:endonuclease-8
VWRTTLEFSFAHAHLQCYEEELAGQRVDAVETRGKALLIRFEGGLSIYSHNQLYGRWYVRKHGSYPRTGRQLRLAIHTEKKSALLYSASDIAVLDAEGIREHPFLRKLGPDILDPELRPARIAKRLQDAAFAGRQLGSLLLDQGFLAGNGNYLRSEILFVAGLLPLHRPKQLEDSQLQALARAVRSIARRTYKTGGITNDPQLVQQAKARGETRSQYRHFVFARAGKPCRVCGTAVEREDRAGRRLYYCPHCQL